MGFAKPYMGSAEPTKFGQVAQLRKPHSVMLAGIPSQNSGPETSVQPTESFVMNKTYQQSSKFMNLQGHQIESCPPKIAALKPKTTFRMQPAVMQMPASMRMSATPKMILQDQHDAAQSKFPKIQTNNDVDTLQMIDDYIENEINEVTPNSIQNKGIIRGGSGPQMMAQVDQKTAEGAGDIDAAFLAYYKSLGNDRNSRLRAIQAVEAQLLEPQNDAKNTQNTYKTLAEQQQQMVQEVLKSKEDKQVYKLKPHQQVFGEEVYDMELYGAF